MGCGIGGVGGGQRIIPKCLGLNWNNGAVLKQMGRI